MLASPERITYLDFLRAEAKTNESLSEDSSDKYNTRILKAKPGETVVELKGITKRFDGVVANDHIDFDVKAGEIHALLGENGAGKTTLMNILYGLYQPDEGEIRLYGRKVTIKSPKEAIDLGIGMVHQHFMLVPTFSVVENVILGLETSRNPLLDLDKARKEIIELSERFGLQIEPEAKICQLSVGEQQRVEIIKALYRNVRVLILDEPTSMLTPLEVKELMGVVRRMLQRGLAAIAFITHKLPEIMAISDRVTVLREGKVVETLETKCTSEEALSRKMVGVHRYRDVRPKTKKGKVVLVVENLDAVSDNGLPALKDVSFSIHEGEILGIAGVSGNGQRELEEVIMGLRKAIEGKVIMFGRDMTNLSPREIIDAGVGYVPEDRIARGLIMDFSIAENAILGSHSKLPFVKKWLLDSQEIVQYARKLISEYDIQVSDIEAPAKYLSGGNMQKLILARKISRNPKLLIAAQPTRGLDIKATEFIRRKIMKQREKGLAVLWISEDLDEIMTLSDHIAVMYEGEIVNVLPIEKARIEEIGQLMAGGK